MFIYQTVNSVSFKPVAVRAVECDANEKDEVRREGETGDIILLSERFIRNVSCYALCLKKVGKHCNTGSCAPCVCHGGLNDTSALVDFEKRWFRPSKVTYMCVPISLTSWWMTSSIQLSGLSSEKAEFEADKFNLWELVCRSACERRESWDSSETKQLPQLQKILYHFTRAVTFTRISLTTWLLSLCTLM